MPNIPYRVRLLASLMALSILSGCFLAIRFGLLRMGWYVFINWNLFLAWIPLGLSLYFEQLTFRPSPPKCKLLAVGSAWVLFFPNAPYVITDLIHIQNTTQIPLWHDAIMIFCYALASLFCGLLSYHWMNQSMQRIFPIWSRYVMMVVLPLAGFGIYLGRVKRLNSWHLITKPKLLIQLISESLVSRQALLMTIEFSFLIGFCYLLLLSLMKIERN
ncbi:MAG: DUF1361 domain-containing protein [Siphonobacter sp.]